MEEKVLVIDVGGTFIKYGLIDEQCHLTQTSKIKTPYQSQEHFLETLQNIYLSYQNVHIQGIAMSVPGKIDVMQGVMLTSGALVYLEGLRLAKKLSALCDHVPVSVENDGKAAALCESWVGQAKDCQSCVVLIFGSGIGGGISQDVLFVEKIKEKIDEVFGKAYLFRKPQVKSCQYHNDSNLIGAYYTYRQLFSKDGEKNENNFKGR